MAENSKIEWCDHTFNPWIGCTKVGPGCDHCYAEALMQDRYHRVRWGAGAERELTSDSNWKRPQSWNRRAANASRRPRVFCASLADVFDNEVPGLWRRALFDLIRITPHLDWLLLTKRIGNAPDMLPDDWGAGWPHVWLGATVVTQDEANRDVPKLLQMPAAVRFLSCEPLLGPLNLPWLRYGLLDRAYHSVVDWVIVGGESGIHARPMQPEWCSAIARQCAAAGTAFFMKQGSRDNWPDWKDFARWPADLQVRQHPESMA